MMISSSPQAMQGVMQANAKMMRAFNCVLISI